MADKADNSKDATQSNCKFCKKTAEKSFVKCVLCKIVLHYSCAFRIPGLTVIGKDNLVECCRSPEKGTDQSTNTIFTIDTDSHLREVVESKNEVIKEMRNNQDLLYKTVGLLEDQIVFLKGNCLRKTLSDKQLTVEGNQILDKEIASTSVPGINKPWQKTSTKAIKNQESSECKNVLQGHRRQVDCSQRVDSALRAEGRAMSASVGVEENELKEDLPSDTDGFTEVKQRKGRFRSGKPEFKTVYATGENQKTSKISGTIRRKWMYVGRIAGKEVSVEDVSDYMQDLSGERGYKDITVTKLQTQGNNSAFSIGLPSDELYARVFDVNYWPRGVALREFNLHRTFLHQRRQQMKS